MMYVQIERDNTKLIFVFNVYILLEKIKSQIGKSTVIGLFCLSVCPSVSLHVHIWHVIIADGVYLRSKVTCHIPQTSIPFDSSIGTGLTPQSARARWELWVTSLYMLEIYF